MTFHPFVLPFIAGLSFIIIYFFYKTYHWISGLSDSDKKKLRNSIFTQKTYYAAKEVFLESLLHRKIFRINPLLGYMHASLAFGWFLLIVIGNLESRLYHPSDFNPPYYPIFLGFFDTDSHHTYWYAPIFKFIMNLLLIIVLSGVLLALLKRLYAGLFKMKKTTHLKMADKIPLYSLWLIFPARLMAESVAAAIYQNGGFLTTSIGKLLATSLATESFMLTFYWLYSIALGIFFCSLPWSRYMHIPSEVVLIFFRNYGIHNTENNKELQEVELLSCSRCGICIDTCQIMTSAKVNSIQAVYFLKSLREKDYDRNKAFNCLMCGRCEKIWPVGISINMHRQQSRNHISNDKGFLETAWHLTQKKKAKIAYFSGCMTRLTPSVIVAMKKIFSAANENWIFLDENNGICCGRPTKLAGLTKKASELAEANKSMIHESGADLLISSCPICVKTFTEDYHLNLPVFHHSVYLNNLIKAKKINVQKIPIQAIYHDPCELGRGLHIYDEPRQLLSSLLNLKTIHYSAENALCCGNSVAGFHLSSQEKDMITKDALIKMNTKDCDIIATACPMCKKSFVKFEQTKVKDLAEILEMAITK